MLTSKMTHMMTELSELKPNQLDKIPNDLFSKNVLKWVQHMMTELSELKAELSELKAEFSELKPDQLNKIPNDLFSKNVLKFAVYSDLMIWSNVSCRYRKAVDIYMDRYSKTYEYLIQVWENFNILKTKDPGMFYLPLTKNLPRTYIGPQTNESKRQHFCSIAWNNPIKFLLIHSKCRNETIHDLKVMLKDIPPRISEKRLHHWFEYCSMGSDSVEICHDILVNFKGRRSRGCMMGGEIIEDLNNGRIGINLDAIRSNISHIFDEIASCIMDDGFMPCLQKNNKLSFFN